MKKMLLVAVLALVGCQETTGPVTLPDGKKAETVKCSQTSQSCLVKAGEACNGSYQVLDSYSKSGGLIADVMPGPVTWYYLSFQCGRSDGRMPAFPFRGADYQMPQSNYASCTTIGNTTNCYGY